MSEHFDAATAAGAGLTNRRQAWSLIADIAAAFSAAPLEPEDGVPEDELRRAERAGFPPAGRAARGLQTIRATS